MLSSLDRTFVEPLSAAAALDASSHMAKGSGASPAVSAGRQVR
jgi:hypothetical protein